MNTSANTPSTLAKMLAAAFVLTVIGVLMTASRLTLSTAAGQERTFENKIPVHIPIKIRIKKEKEESFKDVNNEKWLRDFELEVTNTGEKPIYFLYITMGTNVKVDNGLEMVYPLVYGRPQLGDIFTKATSDDVPIKPHETYTLKIGEAPYFEKGVREKRWPQSTKFTAEIQVLSFGDGTGYFGNEAFPPTRKSQAALNRNSPTSSYAARGKPTKPRIGRFGAQSKSSSMFNKPTFLSANFLSEENVIETTSSVTHPFVACEFPECTPVVPWTGYVCYDNDETKNSCRIQNRPTTDQVNGICKELELKTAECIAGTFLYLCRVINVYDCGLGPGPQPSPSPSPSPRPCEYCDDPNALRPADCSDPAHPKCDSFLEYEQFGCCYRQTCAHVGRPEPLSGPPPCAPGYFRTTNEWQEFPICDYVPCVPLPPDLVDNADTCQFLKLFLELHKFYVWHVAGYRNVWWRR